MIIIWKASFYVSSGRPIYVILPFVSMIHNADEIIFYLRCVKKFPWRAIICGRELLACQNLLSNVVFFLPQPILLEQCLDDKKCHARVALMSCVVFYASTDGRP